MASALKISEAASIGIHAAVYMAANAGGLVTTKEIAKVLDVSEAHLAKVLQWMVQAGIVVSIRGPRGGFELGRAAGKISLSEVYEAIDGKLAFDDCLFDKRICRGDECIFGGLLSDISMRVMGYLKRTKLTDVAGVYKKGSRRQ